MANSGKIFGIGLNKTGTTTLAQCAKILGLKSTSHNRGLLEDFVVRNDMTNVKRVVEENDLFEDWPWPLMYKQLDEMFPGSKFILTTRKSPEVWLKSLKKHSMTTHPTKHCRKMAYGFNFPHNHEQHHIDFYNRHNAEVREYFAERSEDFIELCWENGDGFKELCEFLNVDVVQQDLPHVNKGGASHVSWLRRNTNLLLSKIL